MKLLLLLNMGGPRNEAEIEVFLKNMFNDPAILSVKSVFLRKILANLITQMRLKTAKQNYAQIGGKSPICEITQRLCDKINKLQNKYIADYAMNYTPPFCQDVLKKYDNLDEIIIVPLYPHHSVTTVASSINEFNKGYKMLNLNAKIKIIQPFYDNKNFNKIIINSIKNTNANISKTTLILSAHSLPQSTIDKGDLYEKHVNNQVQILKTFLTNEGINFKDVKLAYQSRLGPVKWLEPSLSDVLKTLDNKKALIYPLSFCIDNSETIFELHKEYKHVADELGYEYYDVVYCPNDSDEFADFLLSLIKE